MIIQENTYTTDYLLPFLFVDKTIFAKEYGFVNAYIGDINRPYYQDKIFILFRYKPKTYYITRQKMLENRWYFDKKEIHINGELYDEYIFNFPMGFKTPINEIIQGHGYGITCFQKSRILNFWKDLTSKHFIELLRSELEIDYGKIKSLNELKEWIPEEDYLEEIDVFNLLTIKRKAG